MAARVVASKYELRRQIGRGGMGAVWEAYDLVLRRLVALKLLASDHASPDALRAFEREAMALAQIRNDHIVQVHDYGVDEGFPYIVMELLHGEDLETRLRREKRLSPSAILTLLRQLADGLTAAVAAGVVHRDLKPANIFLVGNEGRESVKILDFGIASTVSEAIDPAREGEGSHRLSGTPTYMSPEQVRGSGPHPLSDLWSIAVIAYRALVGGLPFQGETLADLFISVSADPFVPPSSLLPDALPGVDAFFERALAKDRSRRYPSARELCEAFAVLCQGTAKQAKILVVDDEPDVQLLVNMHLRAEIRKASYHLLFADNGQAALEELRQHPDVDVVLTDIKMPVMDGLTLLGRIAEVTPMAKTVMVSAYSDMGNIRRAMNEGAFDFLVKPITRDDLKATLAKAIKQVMAHRDMTTSDEENRILRKLTNEALVDRIGALGPSSALASEATSATVVFVDVFGFSPVANQKLPSEALRMLNANFEVIVPALAAKGGRVDKFLGDAVMAVYDGDDHVGRALESCIDVRSQMASIARQAGANSPYAYGLSIGVSTGRVLSGCIGSHACGRLAYTVIGNAVNEAAHLAQAARGGEILVSARVRAEVGGRLCFKDVGVKALGSRGEATLVYNVVGEGQAGVGPEAAPTVEISTQAKAH
jgi:eukaryotic-like serine/threonine-protein kinase